MKILHYTLGLPEARTGGLPKYSFDLMCAENKLGNDIMLLYPGEYKLSRNTKIVTRGVKNGVKIYEIVNPQLVSLLNGVRKPKDYYRTCNKDIYSMFLKKNKPDVIHIHTLMGLHKEFIESAKELGIKIIFTTHDYYPLCSKVNLIDYKNEVCNEFEDGKKCVLCNYNSCSNKHTYIIRSNAYNKFKNSKHLYKLYIKLKEINNRIRLKSNNAEQCCRNNYEYDKISSEKSKEYRKLRNYYLEILKLVDYFHFNSNVSKSEFKKYIDVEGEVINISHGDIRDMRVKKSVKRNKELRLTYLGRVDIVKGFYLLKESLELLPKNNVNQWILNVYGNSKDIQLNNDKIIFNGTYEYSMLNKIFENTDLMIVPSIWKETFGFIGLEALSYGVPVMVTDNVGMQDIIDDNVTGFIVKPTSTAISEAINRLINDPDRINEMNDNILKMDFKYTMDIHAKKIINLYINVINKKNINFINNS